MSRRCLLIADGFPPATSSGVYRLAALARLLPACGWEVFVLTTRPPDEPSGYAQWGLPDGYADHVVRVPWRAPQVSPRLKEGVQAASRRSLRRRLIAPLLRLTKGVASLVFFPDASGFSRWVLPACRRGMAWCEETRPDVIYASAPSYSVCTAGHRLSKTTGIPWVCELRDPFYRTRIVHAMPTPFHRALARRMESRWVRDAAVTVVTSQSLREQMLADHPLLKTDRVQTVYNGFDTPPDQLTPSASPPGCFTVTYCGVIDPFRDPAPLLRAARSLADEDPEFARHLCLQFVGTQKLDVAAAADAMGLGGQVTVLGQVPHAESVRLMRASDVLLHIGYYVRGGGLEIPAKTYDYIASGRPILMLSGPGEAADIVARSGIGVVVPPTDVEAIKTSLRRLWEGKRDGGQSGLVPDQAYIAQFDRGDQVRRIAEILETAVTSTSGNAAQ